MTVYEYIWVIADPTDRLNTLAKDGYRVVPGIYHQGNEIQFVLLEREVPS